MVTTLAKEDRHNKNRAIDKPRGWVSLVTIIITVPRFVVTSL